MTNPVTDFLEYLNVELFFENFHDHSDLCIPLAQLRFDILADGAVLQTTFLS